MTSRRWVTDERDELLKQLKAGVDREHVWRNFEHAVDEHISREATAATKDWDERCAVVRAQNKAERESGVGQLTGSDLAKRMRSSKLDRCRCRENELLMMHGADEIIRLQGVIRALESAIQAHQNYEAQVRSLLKPAAKH